MCGRFAITLPDDAMARLFDAAPANDLPPVPRYNICPTQPVAVVISAEGRRRYGPMRWGFIPRWYKTPTDGPLLFNARSETIAEKPAFREAARQRRCLIPASGFFEWTKDGQTRLPWYITRSDGAPMVFAGVWQSWQGTEGTRIASCAIVTAAAQDEMAALHGRVPVVLDPGNWGKWLGEEGHGAARLMQAPAQGVLGFRRVGPAVNSNRSEGAELIEPFDA
ncbi:SOS response-associated peptidase [Pararhodobacter zhoushanensis]|uniref:Abasic site processing protein n=1 Tax=Pararhodobacter zhoushanensis TaxID=2479545 RepID=A0ABT3GX42_9RHOB|nr:SOS response-associated peptidase [Pararhodobacter zhoushanensis]MCW1932055.1 SOS response-associated peptidase [Pararhodobacter zhoushanensis]